MIEDLIQLVNLITAKKIRQIEILTETSDLTTKSKTLLEGIKNGAITSDEEALSLLYPDGNIDAYYKLRNRLYNRLLNTLFFLDIKKTGRQNLGQKRDNAYRAFTQLMIVKEMGSRNLAVSLAVKLLEQVKKIELFELSFLLGNFLEEHFSIWNKNQKKEDYYKSIFEESKFHIERIKRVTPIWSELAQKLMTKKTVHVNESESQKYFETLSKLNEDLNKDSAYIYRYRLMSSWYFYFWLKQNIEKQIEVCTRALLHLESSHHNSPIHIVSFRTFLGIAYLNSMDYESAEKELLSLLESYNFTPGLNTWINIHNYLFLIKMIKEQYQEAWVISREVLGLKNFKNLDTTHSEAWLIRDAYVNLLIEIGKIENVENEKPFRLRKFLNTTTLYNKDKSGLNVSILIAQFLFLLIRDQTEELFDKLDALKQYSHRYLKKDPTYRSNCFIKMLMTLPNSDFHPMRIEARTKKLYKNLKATPMMVGQQSHEVEIIPYEHLWEIVMEILQSRIDKKSRK